MSSTLTRAAGIVVTWTVATLSMGCESKAAGSCDWRPEGSDRCFEYTSADSKADCKAPRVWSDKPCNKAGSIGGCKTVGGTTKWLYPTGALKTRADAGTECTEWIDAK